MYIVLFYVGILPPYIIPPTQNPFIIFVQLLVVVADVCDSDFLGITLCIHYCFIPLGFLVDVDV